MNEPVIEVREDTYCTEGSWHTATTLKCLTESDDVDYCRRLTDSLTENRSTGRPK